jgi:hypothetical protein
MNTNVEQKVADLNAFARKVGASGSVIYVRFPKSIVLTYPRTIWPVPESDTELFQLYKIVEREVQASATTNPLRKYMILNSLSFRDMAAILGLSHVRVQAICRTNPGYELRAKIARLVPEVSEDLWPEPPYDPRRKP